ELNVLRNRCRRLACACAIARINNVESRIGKRLGERGELRHSEPRQRQVRRAPVPPCSIDGRVTHEEEPAQRTQKKTSTAISVSSTVAPAASPVSPPSHRRSCQTHAAQTAAADSAAS